MKRIQLFLLLLALSAQAAQAKVSLPAIFGDNMVLQQQTQARIWGDSDKKEVQLNVSWCEQPIRAEVRNGRWEISIPTPIGGFEAQTIRINDADSELTLRNVLIGEVWICSGQSNMAMPLRGYTGQPVVESLRTVLESPRYADRIRMITLPRRDADTPQRDFEGKWEIPAPETSLRMSAAAYFFARELTNTLNVPVGIVHTSWGGSKIEAWMDPASLRKLGYDVEAINANPKIEPRAKCSRLYNGLLAPVAGFSARGFAWYQGESNRKESALYASLMQSMVALWRAQWGDEKNHMPFLYVQIAPYNYNDSAATDGVQVMEAQVDALKLIPNAALIATTDLGEEKCIHPSRKREVGERMALEALDKAYGMKIGDASGVSLKSVEYKDGKAVVVFDNARYGLIPQQQEVTGFELAGADGVYHPAAGRIVASKPIVEVSSDKVSAPVAVRYSFRNYAPGNLANTLGIPAYPFRTDRK